MALFGKLAIAASTAGTDDVRFFAGFARTIGRVGPVNVYGVPHAGVLVYNHGPLTGIMLYVCDRLWSHGAFFPLLIRLPACLADLVTSLVVFELARERMDLRRARWCALAVALSPVLVGVSGFHGNTDPVFVCFVLLSVWLLSSRRRAVSAGVCLGLALSIKIVPVVVVPVLLIAAYRQGRRSLTMFLAGFLAVLASLWGLPLLEYYQQVKANVLDYAGSPDRRWGIPELARWIGVPNAWLNWWVGPGHVSVVLVSSGLGSLLVWRRPKEVAAAAALALSAVLLFSTAGADQYLAWPAAAVFLVDAWSACAYTLLAGVFVTELYTRWSHSFPWGHGVLWDWATARHWSHHEILLAGLVWVALAVNVLLGTRLAFARSTAVGRTPSAAPLHESSVQVG